MGHDLRVVGSSPMLGSALSTESEILFLPLSLCPFPYLLSLKKQNPPKKEQDSMKKHTPRFHE